MARWFGHHWLSNIAARSAAKGAASIMPSFILGLSLPATVSLLVPRVTSSSGLADWLGS